ncbi:MAG: transcriptional repressor [Ruminococcaceae bacterium]|nr:transcriptional repressor [Oscillospiraceae bacterium]
MANRHTIQRDIVLSAVNALRNHPTAEEIYDHIHSSHPTVSRATVYRNLAYLSETGAVLHVALPNTADIYDFNTVPHYHIRCVGCGRVFDIEYPYIADIEAEITDKTGFRVLSHELIFSGLCPCCTEQQNNN